MEVFNGRDVFKRLGQTFLEEVGKTDLLNVEEIWHLDDFWKAPEGKTLAALTFAGQGELLVAEVLRKWD